MREAEDEPRWQRTTDMAAVSIRSRLLVLNPLLARASLVVEGDTFSAGPRRVGDDEADAGIKIGRMPSRRSTVSSLVSCARFGAQSPHDGAREIATYGKSMVALVAFDRLPRCCSRYAIGVQNKTQFNERALRRKHQFAGRGRRGGLCGGPSRRCRRRLQQ
jgi:hypothetical protein